MIDLLHQTRFWLDAGRRYARTNGTGVGVSLVLHGLLVFLALAAVTRRTADLTVPMTVQPVPVDLIRLGEETRSPPADLRSPTPQQKAGRKQEAASPNPRSASPEEKKTAVADPLEAKLKALARLKQPDSPLATGEGVGISTADAASGAPGDSAAYSVRDYVLAQVLRRWTLNLERVRGRPLVIKIAVIMKRDGTITAAEIVEQSRAKTDAVYRDIATGARNAVLLSSPVVLPAGDYPKEMHFTLLMDTRAVLR